MEKLRKGLFSHLNLQVRALLLEHGARFAVESFDVALRQMRTALAP
jgi:hypothetical protein